MKTKVVKILKIILSLFIISLVYSCKVQASEVTASISTNSCKEKESFTVNVNIPEDVVAYQFDVVITYSNGTSKIKHIYKIGQNPDNLLDLRWAGNYSENFTADFSGKATVAINNIILSNIGYQKVNSVSDYSAGEITIQEDTPVETPPSNNTDNPAPPPTPVEVNFSSANEVMYTNRRVNVRRSCGTNDTENPIIQTLPSGTEVTRTGVSDKEKDGYSWSRISYNGVTGYVATEFLTYDKPEETPPEEQEPENPEEVDPNQEKISKISEEFGAIPEVGLNIATFMFLGSSIVCVIMMVEVKRKIAK